MFLCRTQCSVHFFEQSCMFIYRVQFSSYALSILIDFEVFDPVVHPVFDHLDLQSSDLKKMKVQTMLELIHEMFSCHLFSLFYQSMINQ